MDYIPYGRQCIDEDDIEAVVRVLRSDWLTQGPIIERFEEAVAQYCGAKYAVAVNSATSALHIACLAADLGKGDTLWTSPNTFVASANCGVYCGANVDFVDIDPFTYNLSVQAFREKLEHAAENNTLPTIVIPVHFAGQSCEMEEIRQLANQYGITVVEDASHAIGGLYKQTPVGSCQFSDMAVFSFHPVKIITSGEGGMVVTNNEKLYQKLLLMRSHGITRNSELMTEAAHGPWYYQQIELGYNYRITDIQAALGLSQIKKINRFVKRRNEIALKYNQELSGLPLRLPLQIPESYSAYHLYVIRVKLDQINLTHKDVFEALRDAGIGVNLHYIPVHTQPYYQKLGHQWGDYPQSEQYYREAISLPIYFDLSDEQQTYVITKLKEVLV